VGSPSLFARGCCPEPSLDDWSEAVKFAIQLDAAAARAIYEADDDPPADRPHGAPDC
jgi:hypothetical protein